jgi:hypothetical protein
MAGWGTLKDQLMQPLEVVALSSSYGWSAQFIDDIVMRTPDFNVMRATGPSPSGSRRSRPGRRPAWHCFPRNGGAAGGSGPGPLGRSGARPAGPRC